jgi:hypothetical protein
VRAIYVVRRPRPSKDDESDQWLFRPCDNVRGDKKMISISNVLRSIPLFKFGPARNKRSSRFDQTIVGVGHDGFLALKTSLEQSLGEINRVDTTNIVDLPIAL